MLKNMVRWILAVFGGSLGGTLYVIIVDNALAFSKGDLFLKTAIFVSFILIGAALFYILTPLFIRSGQKVAGKMEKEFAAFTTTDIITSVIGLIIGLIIAYFISDILNNAIPVLGGTLALPVYLFLGYFGMRLSHRRKDDFTAVFNSRNIKGATNLGGKKANVTVKPKILDTSVIIDGRIADIAKTGFIEGKLIVPYFVLEELQHIADSSDDLKRAKGRRGLDILNMMQEELKLDIEINEKDFEGIQEVDMKLLKLAQFIDGKILTNDFNLNKVVQFHGVSVLNINELSNAVKPVLIPGEEMEVTIIKEGKENNQGVAYLEDGTMIVVEGAKRRINETFIIVVTSVIQTAAGRMIFAKPKM
ncbi:MAG: PIN/TRAM domain-containing protein [Filifactoraceae bacterium]